LTIEFDCWSSSILTKRDLMMSIYDFVLGAKNPASPAAERMRRHRLQMSQEKMMLRGKRKDFPKLQNVKRKLRKSLFNVRRLIVNTKRKKKLFETQEESVQRKKINRDHMAKQRQTETQEESVQRNKINWDHMAKQRQTETQEENVQRNKINQDHMAKQRQTETQEESVQRKKINQDHMAKQ